jgi:hypothetical protein
MIMAAPTRRAPRAATVLSACALASLALAAQDVERSQLFEGLLRRFDLDLDGRIGPAEYPREARVFRRLDRDRDGFLTARDFGPARPDAAPASVPGAPARPAPSAEQLEFFESRVRPVLAAACFECHSGATARPKGGLRLDSLESLLAGGQSGPAIVPGDPDASLLVTAVRYDDEELQMPPKQRLDALAVADLERWVASGAPWPIARAPGGADAADGAGATAPEGAPFGRREIDIEAGRAFWAFRAPRRSEPPPVKDRAWALSPIDAFLLAAMEARGAAPVGDADRRTWLRRVTFDLTGLPPTPAEIEAFEQDRSSDAHATVVDRLLASKAFGERWGRHWLDVARYAESSGKDSNVLYPHAWRYRDWVIAAFNQDKPYDRFLVEQLAGDLLPAADDDERAQNLIATGYLALGSKGQNERDRRQFALDVADEQIDALSQGMLGLTIACARCHDHKFDPIPTQDYYAMAGILLSTETRYGTMRGPGNNHPSTLTALPAGADVPNGPEMPAAVRRILERLRDGAERQAEAARPAPRTGAGGGARPAEQDLQRARIARQTADLIDELLGRFDERGRPLPSNRLAMGAVEGRARDVAVLDRGELDRPREVVARGVPQVLTSEPLAIGAGSGRLELAHWVASSANPLTARVWANRVWLHLFGQGIVPTSDNFGASGMPPDHPELLDWLALELVEHGWSTKHLVRTIVLSRAYRLASQDDARGLAADPELTTLWRFPDRRLEAEAIRDAMLFASGRLQLEPPVGSPVGVLEGIPRNQAVLSAITAERPVRSVYLPILRGELPDALAVFDVADPAFVTGQREDTNVATQALYLMNDPDVIAAADAFARRLIAQAEGDDARIELAFQLALGRPASGSEKQAARRFLDEFERLAPGEGNGAAVGRGGERGRGARDTVRDPGGATRGAAGSGGNPARDAGDAARDSDSAPRGRFAAWSAFAQSLFASAEFRYLG